MGTFCKIFKKSDDDNVHGPIILYFKYLNWLLVKLSFTIM